MSKINIERTYAFKKDTFGSCSDLTTSCTRGKVLTSRRFKLNLVKEQVLLHRDITIKILLVNKTGLNRGLHKRELFALLKSVASREISHYKIEHVE